MRCFFSNTEIELTNAVIRRVPADSLKSLVKFVKDKAIHNPFYFLIRSKIMDKPTQTRMTVWPYCRTHVHVVHMRSITIANGLFIDRILYIFDDLRQSDQVYLCLIYPLLISRIIQSTIISRRLLIHTRCVGQVRANCVKLLLVVGSYSAAILRSKGNHRLILA